MATEMIKDKIKLSQIVGQKQELINIDGDVIVSDIKPDVLKVVSTNGTVFVYKKEVLDGKIKIEGNIDTYIIYLADNEENSIRSINTSLDFAEIIDMENCKEGMLLDVGVCLKGFETRVINGRKLHVKAFLNVNAKVYKTEEIEAIVDVQNDENDIQMLNCNKKMLSLIAENTGKTTLKETIKMQEELAEIMKVNIGISEILTKTSYNKVLIKANANISIMYLAEDNNINITNVVIPVMGFIDMPDITEKSECLPTISLRSMVLRQNNEEENSIYIEADLDLYCKAFETKEINIIEDVYGISKDVNLEKMSARTIQEDFKLTDTINVNQKLTIPDLVYGKILGVNITPNLESVDVREGKIKYEAILKTEFMVQNDRDVNTVNVDIPFNFELSNNSINTNSNIETEINIVSQQLDIVDDGVILDVKMEINAGIQNDETIYLARNIELKEPQNIDIYSMIIYFVKSGDTLWKIAKKFRTKAEDIARVNGIEDENRIYPGQQLYIPKFTRRQIAV